MSRLTDEERRLRHNASHREYMKRYKAAMSPERLAEFRAAHNADTKRRDAVRDHRLRATSSKLYRVNLKADVLAGYGGACVCCGEDQPEFLTIDHIVPVRKSIRAGRLGQYSMYLQLRKANFPDGYQLLCFNCNHAKGVSSECPHKRIYQQKFTLLKGLA